MNHFSGSVDPDLALQFGTVTEGAYPATVSNLEEWPQFLLTYEQIWGFIAQNTEFKVKMYNEVKIVHNHTSQKYMELYCFLYKHFQSGSKFTDNMEFLGGRHSHQMTDTQPQFSRAYVSLAED